MCICVYVYVCMYMCVCLCVYVCVRVCVHISASKCFLKSHSVCEHYRRGLSFSLSSVCACRPANTGGSEREHIIAHKRRCMAGNFRGLKDLWFLPHNLFCAGRPQLFSSKVKKCAGTGKFLPGLLWAFRMQSQQRQFTRTHDKHRRACVHPCAHAHVPLAELHAHAHAHAMQNAMHTHTQI